MITVPTITFIAPIVLIILVAGAIAWFFVRKQKYLTLRRVVTNYRAAQIIAMRDVPVRA
jgi:hypothetical protein